MPALTTRIVEHLGLYHPLLTCHLLQEASQPALPLSLGNAGCQRGSGWCPVSTKRLSALQPLCAQSSGGRGLEAPQLDCGPAPLVPGGTRQEVCPS